MKKTTAYFVLSLLLSSTSISFTYKLDVPILEKIDGINILGLGINGTTITMIKQYQSEIKKILVGELQKDGSRKGKYQYGDEKYSAQELQATEAEVGTNPRFRKMLKTMRTDFDEASKPFREIVSMAKGFMKFLIEESCKKRNRVDSLLNVWAHSDQKDEVLFDTHVKNIRDFAIFTTDLYNFLSDLVESCPKAQAQFIQRVEKYKKVKQLLPQTDIAQNDYLQALNSINPKLGKIKLEEITVKKIKELANIS